MILIQMKNYPVLVNEVSLEDSRRMSLDGLEFFGLTRTLKIKGIWDVKRIGFVRVKLIFDKQTVLSRTLKSNRSF